MQTTQKLSPQSKHANISITTKPNSFSVVSGMKFVRKATTTATLATMTLLPVSAASIPLATGLAVTGAAVTATEPAEAASRRIRASYIAALVNRSLSRSTIHLNSLGRQRGNSWHQPNSSYVRLYGYKRRFTIDEYRFKKGKFRYAYNVNRITSRSIRVTPKGNRFELTVRFPRRANIKGYCRGHRWGLRGCIIGKDKAAPDVRWDFPQIKADLRPYAYNGGIAFNVSNVRVGGRFKLNGLLRNIVPVNRRIKKAIIPVLKRELNKPSVKRIMARSTRRGLARFGVRSLKRLNMHRGYITVSY